MYALSSPPPLKPPPLTPRRVPSPALLSPGGRRGRLLGSSEEGHLRDLSPATTLRAFSQQPIPYDTTRDEYKIFRCIESLTAAERDLGVRVAKAAQRLKNWCREIEDWGWSGSFEQPSDEYREQRRKSLELRIREHVGNSSIGGNVPALDYWGSLLSVEVEAHEARLDDIGDELLELDIEELKEHVLDMHPSSKSRPSSAGYGASHQKYKPMDDFSFLITQTLLSALPHYSQLKERLSTWTARVSILRAAPRYLEELKTAQKAMRLGWEAITPPTDDSDLAFEKWKEAMETISGVLRGKVSGLGQSLDRMLDTLEGRADCLPEDWIDIFEGVETDLGRWTHESRRRVLEFDVRRKMEYGGIDPKHRASPRTVEERSDHGTILTSENDQHTVISNDESSREQPQFGHIMEATDSKSHSQNISGDLADVMQELGNDSKAADLELEPEGFMETAIRSKPTDTFATNRVKTQSESVANHSAEIQPNPNHFTKGPDLQPSLGTMSKTIDIKPHQETGLEAAHTKTTSRFGTSITNIQSEIPDVAESPDTKLKSEATRKQANFAAKTQIRTEKVDINIESEDSKGADIKSDPTVNIDVTHAQSASKAVVDNLDEGSFPATTEHTTHTPKQTETLELESPIDEDSIFEEGDTVVHNEIEEEMLQDDTPLESKPNAFSDSPVIITTTEPDNTETDRPRTPRSRAGSTASNCSNVSFSSSPLSVTDDSPSIRNTSNRQVKIPRPELNAAMTKRRPAKKIVPASPEATIESAPWPPTQFAHKPPTSADDLERKISDILTTIPAHIRLKTSADSDAHRARHNRSVTSKSSRGYLRATRSISGLKSPEITLSPVKGNFDANGAASGRKSAAALRGDNDIKLYHLTQPGKEHPIKLFIRRVGENGERVMVRVGGGWADLGEYLRQYAEHHGRRTVSDGKFEILGLEVKSSDISPSRPESALSKRDRRFSSGTQANSPNTTPVKSSGPVFTTDEAPPPFPSFISSTPGVVADASAPSTGSTQRSWKGDEVGLAGPKTKKFDLSGEKLDWIEGMMKQARTVSTGSMVANSSNTPQQQPNERNESRSESRSQSRTAARKQHEFGDLGKVGGTKRIFMRGGGLGEQH